MPKTRVSYKHLVGELRDQWKDHPGFVCGNGVSKSYININVLKKHGPILGCNLAFTQHHVDYLGYRDSKVRLKCLEGFHNYHIIPMMKFSALHTKAIEQRLDNLYFFDTAPERTGMNIENSKLVMGSTGYIILQVARLLGCNPIVLVGMDGCAENVGGDLRSNCFSEDTKMLKRDFKGKKSSPHLMRFATKNEKLCRKYISEGIDVYKLGSWGVLDLPTMDPGELECLKKNIEMVPQ
jgi:hypothetical protein